jgi:hypothetical protein
MDSDGITWIDASAAWDVPGLHEADLNGIHGEYRAPDMDTSEDGTNQWFWMVKPTGTRSEFPEVYNCGMADCETEARKRAENFMREADAAYGHPFKNA